MNNNGENSAKTMTNKITNELFDNRELPAENGSAQAESRSNNRSNETESETSVDKMIEDKETSWVEVSKIRRYKAAILAENVPGENQSLKLNNVNSKISNIQDFMGSRITYFQNKRYVTTTFGKKESMEEACKRQLFENNDFTLTPINN
jgi:hypothetical protein